MRMYRVGTRSGQMRLRNPTWAGVILQVDVSSLERDNGVRAMRTVVEDVRGRVSCKDDLTLRGSSIMGRKTYSIKRSKPIVEIRETVDVELSGFLCWLLAIANT